MSIANISSLNTGLNLWLPLTPTSMRSTTVYDDKSGNQLHATAAGSPAVANDNHGNARALQFTGVPADNKYLDIADGGVLNFTGAAAVFSVACWIYLDGYDATFGSCICSKAEGVNYTGWWYIILGNNSAADAGKQCVSNLSAGLYRRSSSVVPLASWHHIGFNLSIAGTGIIDTYLDGVKDTPVSDPATAEIQATSTNFTVGRIPYATAYDFNGRLKDLRIYNRLLTANEFLLLSQKYYY